ncbi:MAG TPA: TIGR02530 family flagellar biosynthesis protein [Solirubrobacteraceae bacterium]|nr:TIGR02530 family flagellar biosynthesis protein [Solirubrobacteraceae bacterium]
MSSVLPNPALVAPGPVGRAGPVHTPATPASRTAGGQDVSGPSFADLLAKQTSAPQFSRHALERLQQRGVTLDQPTLGRLTDGVQRAAGKGSRDSVVFVDGTAYVVSVTNNTVITAVPSEHMRQHVFTNIDSAVIA